MPKKEFLKLKIFCIYLFIKNKQYKFLCEKFAYQANFSHKLNLSFQAAIL